MQSYKRPAYNTPAMGLAALFKGIEEGRQQGVENDQAQQKINVLQGEQDSRNRYYDAMAKNAENKDPMNMMGAMQSLQGIVGQNGMRLKSYKMPNGMTLEADSPDAALTAGQKTAKDKMTNEIFETVEINNQKRKLIDEAESVLPNLPTGLIGSWEMKFKDISGKPDKKLEDWQKVKAVLTDAQLLNTAKTKGAISDKEMDLFAQAAANGSIQSVSKITPVLKKLRGFIDAQEKAMKGAYKKNYGEDPSGWFGGDGSSGGYTLGQIVKSNGKSYKVVGLDDPNDPDLEEV